MVKNFGSGRGIENIKARAPDIVVAPGSTVSLDLGDKKVDIIDFGFGQRGAIYGCGNRNRKSCGRGIP